METNEELLYKERGKLGKKRKNRFYSKENTKWMQEKKAAFRRSI